MHLGKPVDKIPFDKIYKGMNVGAIVEKTEVSGKVIDTKSTSDGRGNMVNLVVIDFNGGPISTYDHNTLDWCHYVESLAN